MSVMLVDSTEDLDELLLNRKNLVVVQCSAKWCGPCKRIAPLVEELSEQTPSVTFVHVDVEKVDVGITSVPTFLFFQNGEQVHAFVGADIKKLMDGIQKYSA